MFELANNEEVQDRYTLHSVVPQLGLNDENEKFIMIFFYVHDDEEEEIDNKKRHPKRVFFLYYIEIKLFQ